MQKILMKDGDGKRIVTKENMLVAHGKCGCFFEDDLILSHTKLKCKVLVFDNIEGMKIFALHLGISVNLDDCYGACFNIAYSSNDRIYVDPRYFAMIFFVKGKINTLSIAHESLHAVMRLFNRSYRENEMTIFYEDVSCDRMHQEEFIATNLGDFVARLTKVMKKYNLFKEL